MCSHSMFNLKEQAPDTGGVNISPEQAKCPYLFRALKRALFRSLFGTRVPNRNFQERLFLESGSTFFRNDHLKMNPPTPRSIQRAYSRPPYGPFFKNKYKAPF